MNFHYEDYLAEKLSLLQAEMELSDFKFFVEEEQMFVKHGGILEEKAIYCVVKYMSSTLEIGSKTQPIQVIILTEQDSLSVAKAIFDKFAADYNWKVESSQGEFVKQQHSTPVVLSNFNEAAYGYRSVMYMSSTLYITENIADVTELKVDGEDVTPVTFSLNYSMTPNSQQMSDRPISQSVKSVSSLSIAMVIPCLRSAFLYKITDIMSEEVFGNENFYFSFKIGGVEFSNRMKLISAQMISAPNQIPSLQLGFMM